MALNTVQAILRALANRLQEAEDAAFTLITALSDPTLNSIVGDLLDKVGARVGEPRGGRSDADYLVAIRIRVRVNRSRGKAEDIVQVAILASVNSVPTYAEYYPASFLVTALNLPGAGQVAKLLGRAKSAGTYGVLAASKVGQNGFVWGDTVSGVYGANSKWGDTVAPSGSTWMSSYACPKPPGT